VLPVYHWQCLESVWLTVMLVQNYSNTVILSDSNDVLNVIIWKNICIRPREFVNRALQMLCQYCTSFYSTVVTICITCIIFWDSKLCPQTVLMSFTMIHRLNSDYFPEQHYFVLMVMWCFMCSRNWIFHIFLFYRLASKEYVYCLCMVHASASNLKKLS
jgi:hypothetical protein